MTEREFLVNLSVNLGHLWNPADMQRSAIVKYLQLAIDDFAIGEYERSREAMNAATERVKIMIQQRKESNS